jgi:hypothetical protein
MPGGKFFESLDHETAQSGGCIISPNVAKHLADGTGGKSWPPMAKSGPPMTKGRSPPMA